MARSPSGRISDDPRRADRRRSSSRDGRNYSSRDSHYSSRDNDRRDDRYRRHDDRRRDESHRRDEPHRDRRPHDRQHGERHRGGDDSSRHHERSSISDRGTDRSKERAADPVRGGTRNNVGHERPRGAGNDRSKHTRRSSDVSSRSTPRPKTADQDSKMADEEAKTKLDQEEKAKRLARVQAWKDKRNLTDKVSQPTTTTPTAEAESPATQTEQEDVAITQAQPPAGGLLMDNTPRAKFDPNVIKKRAQAALDKVKGKKVTLGDDAMLPPSANRSAPAATSQINAPNRESMHRSQVGAHKLNETTGHPGVHVGDAKISGFGLSRPANDKGAHRTSAGKTALSLDEDEEVERKFKPIAHDSSIDDATPFATGDDDQDDGHDLRSEEEEAQAARESAQKRSAAMQLGQPDASMTDAPAPAPLVHAKAEDMDVDEEEEEDSLDAFMKDLSQPKNQEVGTGAKRSRSVAQFFDDDGDMNFEAVGDNTEELLHNAKKKKKEVPTVDHGRMQYEPFRKEFYTESEELKAMSEEDAQRLRFELDDIKARGINPPKPVMGWAQCGFSNQILDVIREQGFEKPTPIQAQALPTIMAGRDTIGIAKTGSGKTLAFILPMFRHIKDQRPLANLEGPIGLILAPTRELAVQIHRECKPYFKTLNLRGVAAYGGAQIKDQIAEIKRGAEVLVGTPGRLIDLLTSNAGRVINLRRVTYVVLDEADRMFDMGFEPQIAKILNNVRPDRQAVFFSATFPVKMEQLARKALKTPVEIMAGGRPSVAAEITQVIEVCPQDLKFNRVLALLGALFTNDEDARVLIFVERQETADSMFKELANKGYPSLSVHGGREQIDRDQAILDFKNGYVPVMVATSVAARGLDVKQLKLVINFDCPNHGEDYVHRAGRTGRAGNTGTAVTFVTPDEDRFAPFLIRALKDSKQEIPADLQELAKQHKEKIKAGEAKQAGWGGFGGRGIERLDAARAAERAREKRQHKAEDEPEEEEVEGDKSKSEKDKVDELVAKAIGAKKDGAAQETQGSEAPAQARESQPEQAGTEAIPGSLADRLNNFARVQRYEVPPPSAEKPVAVDRIAAARAAASNINSRIGTGAKSGTGARAGGPPDNHGPDAGAFHTTIEINDFPQKARWAVTNRANVVKILESTGTSITSKGIWYDKGKEPAEGEDPKLYILVEGETEIAVLGAVRELSRLLTEGIMASQSADSSRAPAGRYVV